MKLPASLFAASLAAMPAACASASASDAALQATAGLMVSIGQHAEGIDPAVAAGQLDAQLAAAAEDPYVLKLGAMARSSLADAVQDRATRVKLRREALEQFDRAISLSRPDAPARTVMVNGQPMEVDFTDLADLRARLFHTVMTDR